ncbi:MAG: hypothetical protein L6Q98_16520 [Anaerolineae bacterium]|nr:hypothetical protein [Anaerolineae bacterium]NUQ04383.1 hypothetical protein [Anaerolineae bacterium]
MLTQTSGTAQLGVLLEHFYYGQLFYQGRPQGELQLLASSPGVSSEQVEEALNASRIPPMPGVPNGSWALVRGKSLPFLLAQAQIGSKGQSMRHVILMSPEGLRGLGGNLTALSRLVEGQMPTYEHVGNTVPPLTFSPTPPSGDDQQRALLALLGAARDRMDVVEALLSALIQGVQIVVRGAPNDLGTRAGFIEGLLALLPPPARFGVTFATHTLPSTRVDAQVRFYTDEPLPQNALIYDWEKGQVDGKRTPDEYSKYIKSLLRLDLQMVVDQTLTLTPVAGWRLKRGEALAEALTYAARRMVVDAAVTNNQPIEAAEVARILAEDPTLDEATSAAYVRHLLAFALVLEEIEQTDLLSLVVRGKPALERVILQQMDDALGVGKADRVYRVLARWLSNPFGFSGMYWVEMTQKATIAYAEQLAQRRQIEALNAFLRHVRKNQWNIEVSGIIPQLIEVALPLASLNESLAANVFALGASALPGDRWRRFVTLKPLIEKLPEGLKRLAAYLNNDDRTIPPVGLMAQIATEFGEEWRPLMITRLIEAALLAERRDLIDAAALALLARAAPVDLGSQETTYLWIVRSLSDDATVQRLGPAAAHHLLRILLLRGRYDELAAGVMRQGRLIYPPDKQMQFANMLRALFHDTRIEVAAVAPALSALSTQGLKPLPLAMAYYGALEQHNWPPGLDEAATELTRLVFSNRLILEAIQFELIIELLDYHVRRRDENYIARVTSLIPAAAIRRGDSAIDALVRIYRSLDWSAEIKATGLDMLRRYIRLSGDSFAPKVIAQLKLDLGAEVSAALEATHIMRRLIGGEELADYAYSLHTTAKFLYDTGLTYTDRGNLPSVPSLMSDLDSLNGNLTDAERRAIANAILDVGRALVVLSDRHRRFHAKDTDEQIQTQLDGAGNVETIFDIFRVMAGYFGRGRRLSVRTDRLLTNHPLGDRAAPALMREVQQINRLLKTALRAFGEDEKIALTPAAIRGELESLWAVIALYERRTLVKDLAIDLQRIPELALMITEKADVRTLQDSGVAKRLDMNRQRPENTLEFYRFVHGYFKARVRGD